jgi:hypothetical protein
MTTGYELDLREEDILDDGVFSREKMYRLFCSHHQGDLPGLLRIFVTKEQYAAYSEWLQAIERTNPLTYNGCDLVVCATPQI